MSTVLSHKGLKKRSRLSFQIKHMLLKSVLGTWRNSLVYTSQLDVSLKRWPFDYPDACIPLSSKLQDYQDPDWKYGHTCSCFLLFGGSNMDHHSFGMNFLLHIILVLYHQHWYSELYATVHAIKHFVFQALTYASSSTYLSHKQIQNNRKVHQDSNNYITLT